MNNVEAKFILQGYRSNGADANDPAFAAALEQARHDPAVRSWLVREQAFDKAISAKLAEIQAPAGLRESILAGGRVTAPERRQRAWWQNPAVFAVAASVAVILSIGLAWWPRPANASMVLAEFALADAAHPSTHGGHGPETGSLQAALSQPNARFGQALPVDFASLRKTGCRTVSFEGHDLLEVCFKRDGAWFHCYIAQRKDFSAVALSAVPSLINHNGQSLAAWADASYIFMVATEASRSALQELL